MLAWRCTDQKDCLFYWTGTSHGASCQVANPEGCWKTSLRKQFLTQKQGTSRSFTRAAVGTPQEQRVGTPPLSPSETCPP